MPSHHLAQINIARPRAPRDDALMADFYAALDEINALAEASPGFVWRLTDDGGGDATTLRPYGSDVMVNMSVWESVEALRDYTYRSGHLEPLRRRREWFHHDGVGQHLVLWWVPARHLPTLAEARERLDLLAAHGPGPEAFTFREVFPAPDAAAPHAAAADAAATDDAAAAVPAAGVSGSPSARRHRR